MSFRVSVLTCFLCFLPNGLLCNVSFEEGVSQLKNIWKLQSQYILFTIRIFESRLIHTHTHTRIKFWVWRVSPSLFSLHGWTLHPSVEFLSFGKCYRKHNLPPPVAPPHTALRKSVCRVRRHSLGVSEGWPRPHWVHPLCTSSKLDVELRGINVKSELYSVRSHELPSAFLLKCSI